MDTKWFKITELIRCYNETGRCKECRLKQAAKALPNDIEENILAVARDVMDPARDELKKPIITNSAFRCPVHNAAVGSKSTSQHVKGQAMDVTAGSPEDNLRLARILVKNGKFDQLILYVNDAKSLEPRFIHVSWKRTGGNRKQILKKTASGYQTVEASDLTN